MRVEVELPALPFSDRACKRSPDPLTGWVKAGERALPVQQARARRRPKCGAEFVFSWVGHPEQSYREFFGKEHLARLNRVGTPYACGDQFSGRNDHMFGLRATGRSGRKWSIT